MAFPETEFKYKPTTNWVVLSVFVPAFIAFLYYFLCMFGFRHYINFLPSSSWTTISIILSMVLGLICSLLFYQPSKLDRKTAWYVTWSTVFCSLVFYNLIAYGLGPAATYFSSTLTTKNIAGRKVYMSSSKSASDYYIDTYDLPTSLFAKLYITESEFDSIPNDVRMHITLKQSFFGMAVENYTFLPNN
jgi:hypothetical protein